MKQLKSLGVSRAILITAYLPILLIGVLLWFVVSDLNQTIQSNQNTQAIVKLTTLFDAVAHTHAVERGVTAGFLGSKGANGRDKLDQARVNADQAVRAFSALNIKDYSFLSQQQFMALTKDLQQQLQQKSQTRNLVDALNPQADAFNYYSALNKLALDSIRRLISLVENNDSAQDLDSRLKLLWIKERAGQYRGMLNGVFSKQITSTVQRERVKGFVEDEKSYLNSFTQWASAEQTNSLLQLAKQQHWKEVSAITSAYISSNALTITETPSNWFDLATKRIQDIKKLSDEFGELIRSSAAEQTSATLVERNTILVISALLLIPTIFIAHKVSSSIAERVHKINAFLKRLSNEHDFTQTIKDNANDEISSIIKSLQKHAEETRKCLRQIQDQNTLSTNLVLKTSDNILANTSEVESQKNQTAEISAAISQMLQAAEAIADDIQTASTEIGSVQKQSISSSQSMQDISSEFATLNGEVTKSNKIINELVEHTDGISQILSNIQSIAEQTNLLALNAAIEAARAGEQGRGFAVVADEVRNLAKRTQDSTGEISSMLSNLSESAQKAISSMSQCLDLSNTSAQKMHENEEKIKPLYNSLNSLNGLFEQIATAAEEQSVVSRQIYVSVQQVDDGANNIYSGNANSQQSLKEMSDNFAYTSELIQRFKVS